MGPRSRNRCGTQFSDADPIQSQTFHWRRKESPHPNCSQCPPFVCWSSRVGRPAATSQDKTSEKPIQHVIWPPGSIADSQGSNAGNLWGFSSMEIFIHWNLPFWQNSKWLMFFFFPPKVSLMSWQSLEKHLIQALRRWRGKTSVSVSFVLSVLNPSLWMVFI